MPPTQAARGIIVDLTIRVIRLVSGRSRLPNRGLAGERFEDRGDGRRCVSDRFRLEQTRRRLRLFERTVRIGSIPWWRFNRQG